MKKVFLQIWFLLCVLLVTLLVCSCNHNDADTHASEYAKLLQEKNSSKATTHRWFYFTSDGFKETDIPRNAPFSEKKPWTQAIRITSSAFINGKSYLTVNKLGILEAPQTFGIQKNGIASETKLIKNTDLFSKASVGDIYCIDKKPVVNFFTNSIFELKGNNTADFTAQDPFLVKFNTSDYTFSPLLTQQILSEHVAFQNDTQTIPNYLESEIREVFFQNNVWSVLFKSDINNRTDFFALSFSSDDPLTQNQFKEFPTTIKSANEYREIIRPKSSSSLPTRIRDLLKPVPNRVSYYLNYSEQDAASIVQYEHISGNSTPIQAYSLSLEHCSILVFEDGTICFAGALPSKSVLNNGETHAFTLPDLGPGYLYGSIALSGSTLYVAWEETSFFETGKSGFLAVDMEQVLYQNETGE